MVVRARIDPRPRHAVTTIKARCSGLDFACVLRAALTLPAINVALRVSPARVLRSRPCLAKRAAVTASPAQVVRAVGVAARLVGGTCLARAVVTRLLLARAGVPVAIVLGAAQSYDAARLRAHAWIEHEGVPVVDGEPAPAFPAMWRMGVESVR